VWSRYILQDEAVKTYTEATSSQPQVEKRSKKKHETNASILTPQVQETSIPEDKKKEKKKNKKPKPSSTLPGENQTDNTSRPTSEVGGEEDRSEKKKSKKRKHKKTSSSNDDSQADHSNADPGEISSPKKQKTVAESHVRVSYLIFPFDLFGEILCYSHLGFVLFSRMWLHHWKLFLKTFLLTKW
jgi:DNA mismatch repair ATPase MutL